MTDEDYELLQKVSNYTPIYARMKETQIDPDNGGYTDKVWFPLFKWANICRGYAITTPGIVGVLYGINQKLPCINTN